MAKTSLKVKQQKHQSTQQEHIQGAESAEDLMPYSRSMVSAVFASENLLIRARFLELKRQAGKIMIFA